MIFKTGKRVVLRDFREDDLDRHGYWMRPDHPWQRFNAPYYKQAMSDEAIAEHIAGLRQRLREPRPEPRERAAIAEAGTDAYVGMVSRYWISAETHWLALGILLYDPATWNQGLGYEALGLWTEYQFENEPLLARLDLQTWSGNTGMMRLAEKLGYRLEGRFRRARMVDGDYFDSLGYGILREEWAARYPEGFAESLG